MDKRYQVFVSSTYEDLRVERQEIMQALLELDCMPAGMELFPATNDDQWTLIRKVIDECDYYIVVIGGRYGSIGPSGISYTQMEYEYAIAIGKPVLAFLHKDPGAIPAKYAENTEKGKMQLGEFRSLAQQKMCRFWTNPSDLGSAVSRSLVKLVKETPAIGWVKADLLPDINTTEEILRLRKKIEDLQSELSFVAPMASTEDLAQASDPVLIDFTFGAFEADAWDAQGFYAQDLRSTWNEIFSLISPLLIDEASDSILKKALTQYVQRSVFDDIRALKKFDGLVIKQFELEDQAFETIKVQFLALGLMAKSSKRKVRSVSDRAAYWTLTPAGESLMLSLRAIRREK